MSIPLKDVARMEKKGFVRGRLDLFLRRDPDQAVSFHLLARELAYATISNFLKKNDDKAD